MMRSIFRLFASQGRARRWEFVGVTAAALGSEQLLVLGLHSAADIALVRTHIGWIYGASLLVGGWLFVQVTIRRVHDLGRSGGSLLAGVVAALLLVAAAGFIWPQVKAAEAWLMWGLLGMVYLVLAAWPGTVGANRYSPRSDRVSRPTDATNTTGRQLLARMRRMARPTLLLTPTAAPAFSKLGGDPELPAGVDWPRGLRSPRAFVAQLDLAEIRRAAGPEWLPAEGRLYAFYDPDGAGFADHVVILSSLETPAPGRTPPADLPSKMRFPERRAGFLRLTSVPSLEWLGIDMGTIDLADDELDELADLPDAPFGDELQHRVGGYPSEIQGANMSLECEHLARGLKDRFDGEIAPTVARAAKSWRLLLQIDSDPSLKMNWGDGGRLYVFVREKHALDGDFSKTVSLWDTY